MTAEREGLERVIDRIRKLRALARSDNVHEAAAAAASAERLLLEHELAEADLEGRGADDAPTRAEEPLEVYGRNVTRWRSHLACYLRDSHGCAGWLEGAVDDEGRDAWRSVIVGRAGDVATVRYLYGWLSTEVERLTEDAVRRGRGRGRSFRNSFRWGAVAGIQEQIDRMRVEVRAAATSTALAIVDARREAALTLLPAHEMEPMGAPVAPATDPRAWLAGRQAGRSIHVGKALATEGGEAPALAKEGNDDEAR